MTTVSNKIWTKSSYSGGTESCVEFAVDGQSVFVRDSKNKPVEMAITAHDLTALTTWVDKTQ